MRSPKEQEQFLRDERFLSANRNQLHPILPRGRALRFGLILIAAGVLTFVAVVVAGGTLEDTGPLLTIFGSVATVFIGLILCGASVISK